VAPTREQLAEDTAVYLPARPPFEAVRREEIFYVAGRRTATVHRIRSPDLESSLEWTREESRRRGHREVEWWIGESVVPEDAVASLLELGLVPDEVPELTGMTCATEPPAVPEIEVRRVESLEEHLAALEIDWEVWQIAEELRAERRKLEVERWAEIERLGVVHHYAAFLDGDRVGFARGVDMDQGVALFGGSVLTAARGRGVYRALVRARWDHAVGRGTPLLVVQAGEMSAPVLDRLGFVRHGQIRLLVDRL
jgi:hypothetical protein